MSLCKETHLTRNTYKQKMKGWRIFHSNENPDKAGKAILTADKIDLKITNVKRNKDRHYPMTKGSIHERHNNCKYVYTQHGTHHQYIRQVLISIKGNWQ